MEVSASAIKSSGKGSLLAETVQSKKTRKRGRPIIPPKWTRVICFDDIAHYEASSFELEPDFDDVADNPLSAQRTSKKQHEIIFDPKRCWFSLEERSLDHHKLEGVEKTAMAKKVIQRRDLLRDRANKLLVRSAVTEHLDQAEVARLSEKIQRRGSGKGTNADEIKPAEYKEEVPIALRKRCGKKGPLSVRDKIDIVYQVVSKGAPTKWVA